jgi:hypothetical protein
MKYSYIKPRKKTPFTPDVMLIVIFFSITIIMLLSTYFFLLFKDYSFEKERTKLLGERVVLEKNIAKMDKQISFIKEQKVLAQRVFTQNMVLKDSITNLFDLVPERITLSRAELLKNGLILYGVTPSKDVYNFMLQAPLRSIFQKSYTSFYPAGNGWLNFVSTNYIDNDESEELDSED